MLIFFVKIFQKQRLIIQKPHLKKTEVKILEDKEITEMFLARKEEAISAATEKYGGLCLNIAFNILQNREDSKECVNDAMFKVWETVPPQKPQKLAAYLSKIVRNIALDKYRFTHRKKRGCFAEVLEEAEEMYISPNLVEQETERKEMVKAINAFLYSLSPKKRSMFLGRYFLCETLEELSAKFGTNQNTISATLSRTRRELMEYLKKEGYDVE